MHGGRSPWALDRASATGVGELAAAGGILPPALPGHSPHLDLPYDPDEARRLWERTCPGVRRLVYFRAPVERALPLLKAFEKLEDTLGVRIERRWVETYGEVARLAARGELDLRYSGWAADYPDPENFLHDWARSSLGLRGWERSDYWEKVEAARRAQDPEERIRLFREADRLLVEEEVALLPLSYGRQVYLVKPYVRGVRTLVQWGSLKDLIVEPQ